VVCDANEGNKILCKPEGMRQLENLEAVGYAWRV